MRRRKFLQNVGSLAVLIAATNRAQGGLHLHGNLSAVNRILLACYGQSNMAAMFADSDVNTPAANARTFFYNGTIITTPPLASGIRALMNAVNTTTGLDVVSLNGAIAGSGLPALSKGAGTGFYENFLAQTLAIVQSGDAVFMPWDQGEGDADSDPAEFVGYYMGLLSQLQVDFSTDIGRTSPLLISALGNANPTRGSMGIGSTNETWHNIQSQQLNASLIYPNMVYANSNIDAARNAGDGYHYTAAYHAKQGTRIAQAVTTLRGNTAGYAHWEIANAATVDATHTNVNLVHSLGTDFTPTSGIQGFEVSGDNGATWITPTAARTNATQIQLTHSSISTTSARIVRYQYGLDLAGLATQPDGPPTNLVADNSALVVPLTPTAADVKSTPLSVVPCPTWQGSRTADTSVASQSLPVLQLGLVNERKFVILSIMANLTPTSVVLTPNVGTPVSATLVKTQGVINIYKALLGTDANAATQFALALTYASNPFSNSVVDVWTVPHADMSSTTETGTGAATALANTTISATVNASAGGFVIAGVHSSTNYTAYPSAAGSANPYALRGFTKGGLSKVTFDASNVSASAASGFTATVNVSGNLEVALAAWR